MLVEPAEHSSQARGFGLIPLRQVEDVGTAEGSQIDSKIGRRPRAHKKQRILVITRLTPCVFDCQPCLSYSAQPMDRLAAGETNNSPLVTLELPELYKRGVATFKERTQGVVRKIDNPVWRLGAA